MKYCRVCAELKETTGDTCPDCGAYLPRVRVITTALAYGIAAVLVAVWVVIVFVIK